VPFPRAVVLGALVASLLAADHATGQGADESFTDVYEHLRRGSEYARDVSTGRIELTREGADGLVYRYVLVVPDDYDPGRRYPVAFYLHGGVSRPDPGPGGGWWRNYDVVTGHDRIAVLPLSWADAFWWHRNQAENLRAILSEVKRTYNVDENRVYAFGTSDGGTGAYFLAFRDVTPWAGFLPFIAHPAVLMAPQNGADGLMHLGNLTNKPLFIVNGKTDPLYPVQSVAPFLGAFSRVGVDFTFTAKDAGHTTRWWPEEETNIERFIAEHPRDPHPVRVMWASETTDRYNRAHWVVIDELGPVQGDSGRESLANLTADPEAGIVLAVRDGNTVATAIRRVRQLTLLISPEVFDLGEPIRVEVNGEVVFERRVEPDPGVLRKWAARDEDRTMLYAAEITVRPEGAS
jgi:predicted esterase